MLRYISQREESWFIGVEFSGYRWSDTRRWPEHRIDITQWHRLKSKDIPARIPLKTAGVSRDHTRIGGITQRRNAFRIRRTSLPWKAPGEITRLLAEVRGGNRSVESQLAELLYPELHKVAERYMRRKRGNHTLQPTVPVDQAYMQLAHRRNDWKSRSHSIALAAQVMRQILVD